MSQIPAPEALSQYKTLFIKAAEPLLALPEKTKAVVKTHDTRARIAASFPRR